MRYLPLLLLFIIIPSVSAANININFSQTIGTVRNDFYGVGTHGLLSKVAKIDVNNTGSYFQPSNSSWHQMLYGNLSNATIRIDGYLGNRLNKLSQGSFESWIEPDTCTFTQGGAGYTGNCGFYGWNKGYGSTAVNATIRKTTSAFDGSYAINLSSWNGSTSFYIYQVINLSKNNTYNVTAMIQSNTSTSQVKLSVKRLNDSVIVCATAYLNYNNTWTKANCTFNGNDWFTNPSGYQVTIEEYSATNTPRQAIIDDVQVISDNERWNSWFGDEKAYNSSGVSNINIFQDIMQVAKRSNAKVLVILDTPTAVANVTTNCNIATWKCTPLLNQEYNSTLTSFLNNITANHFYDGQLQIEVTNEPDVNNLPQYPQPRNYTDVANVIAIYSNFVYDVVKGWNTTILVGGPGLTSINNQNYSIFFSQYINATKGKLDFYTTHTYMNYPNNADDWLSSHYLNLTTAFNIAGILNPNIIFSEYNLYGGYQKPDKNRAMQMALSLSYMMKINVSLIEFQLSDLRNYSSNTDSYPQRYAIEMEPLLDNYISSEYNITKDFCTYYPPGSTIANTTSDNANITVIADTNGTRRFLTIINKLETSQNVSINSTLSTPMALYYVNGTLVAERSNQQWNVTITNNSVNFYEFKEAPGPTLYNTTMTGNGAYPNTTLECTAYANDTASTQLTATYTWYKDGSSYQTDHVKITSNTQYSLNNISNAFTTGQTWTCGVTISNDYNTTTQTNSSGITISAYPGGSEGAPSTGAGSTTYNPPTSTQNNSMNVTIQTSPEIPKSSSSDDLIKLTFIISATALLIWLFGGFRR